MREEDIEEWKRLTNKYPELAGKAYEIYMRHKEKSARISTYFMWAGKYERRDEKRYRNGLKKYCDREQIKMEIKQWLEN
jgi:hypothetical protein